MDLRLRLATLADMDFARELTRVNMRRYYTEYERVWQGQLFDAEWVFRNSSVIVKADKQIGYFSVSPETGYLYLRDVQLCEPYRGEGVGAWVMDQIAMIAREQGFRNIRLKVFKSNPATQLYQRQGYAVIREDDELFWMECILKD
ncbi:GNAT family N-acetyltransferase [Pseudomonas sp. CCI3.2]|uniref:GNAT family N-acetyltransferase n=1 Tax=unclassified Pseudomonas TaxID=196821 RepID=UPI002AC9CED3|nr:MULTISPECIES: GNAT family N-acetyltransferase [unclassified Pseudomonas]MEB0076518.1 GNAT family N-acetyltransferase [Pseudomonas sp. MH10out]MEB0091266.1 GNAT family N-acetyltransferase [Pseudomonas sp. CCI4.2]MEB0101474.1 GNAT family N-acetyltransferase [Pseudomonas sp. CCI3.2]MEB0128702.1 GNAT family N-acetyltransferase [Pseudomonas sp. CCI2.4]MEB0159363.1 GNAT family N-acetyltransferase [Pseudomonas sp. AH2 (2023)]